MLEWTVFFLLGLIASTFGIMVGTGGGIIIVPMLLVFSDLEPEIIAGTALALVAINSIGSSLSYLRMGYVDRRSGLMFAVAAIPGAVVAPFMVANVPDNLFRIFFGILLLSLALQLVAKPVFKSQRGHSHRFPWMITSRKLTSNTNETFKYRFNEPLAVFLNSFIGFIAAFFGTGGGFIRTPLLVGIFKFPVRVAVATSVFALIIYATPSAIVHGFLGHISWFPILIFTGAGMLIGGQIGTQLTRKIDSKWIERLLIFLLVIAGIRVLIEGIVTT